MNRYRLCLVLILFNIFVAVPLAFSNKSILENANQPSDTLSSDKQDLATKFDFLNEDYEYSISFIFQLSKFHNPIYDTFATSYLGISALNLYALGIEPIFHVLQNRRYPFVRFIQYYVGNFGFSIIHYFIHELGHLRVGHAYGEDTKLGIAIEPIPPLLFLSTIGSNWGERVSAGTFKKLSQEKKHFVVINNILGAFQQHNHMSQLIFEQIIFKGRMNWIEGHAITYQLLFHTFYVWKALLFNITEDNADPIAYRNYMKSYQGINISKTSLILGTFFSAMSNMVLWQNLYLLYKFVAENKRSIPILTWNNVVSFPLVQYQWTRYGDFIQVLLPFLKPFPFFVSFGLGLKPLIVRTGIKLAIPVTSIFEVHPFFNYNFVDTSDMHGFEVGLEVYFNLPVKSLNLFYMVSYSEHDVLNDVRLAHQIDEVWKNSMYDGFYSAFGVQYAF